MNRLQRWQQGDLVALWREAREDGRPRQASYGAEAVTKANSRRALRLAVEDRYGDAMLSLGSIGTASPSDPAALEEMRQRHPAHELPNCSADGPLPLVADTIQVMASLGSIPRGSSPGWSKLRAQHLLDAIKGTTIPAATECLTELTCLTNTLLSGRADRRLSPWLMGAPLTALKKTAGGLRPVAVGEVLRASSAV